MKKNQLEQYNDVQQYVLAHSLRDTELLSALRQETAELPEAIMQIPPEQGQFLALLIKLINAKKIVEIGVFTGYSSLCMALALPDDGQLIALDTNTEWTNIAKKYWQNANVAQKIDLRIKPAKESLQAMIEHGEAGTVDLIFLDADKGQYDTYYEQALTLLKPNGLLVIDNVLLFGSVIDSDRLDKNMASRLSVNGIESVKALNQKVVNDDRVDISMLTMADGISLVRKK